MAEEKTTERNVRLPNPFLALLPVLVLLVIMVMNYLFDWGQDPHIPVVIAVVVAFFVGKVSGYSYTEILSGGLSALNRCLEAILILFLIGVLIGSWLAAGTIPAIVYYGLKLITPAVFLPVACLISAIVAVSMGSSWTTTGTVGIAFMTIGASMGFNPALTAGMCISGAYTGDKLSPLSDTTNLAAASAETDLFDHVTAMMSTTVPSFIIALVLYFIAGMGASSTYDSSLSDQLSADILAQYNHMSLILLIPIVVVIAACIMKVPSLAGIMLSAVLALALAAIFQGATFSDLITFSHYGYGDYINEAFFEDEELHALVIKLLDRGGMDSMCWTINLVIVAVAFGGILEKIGAVESLMGGLLKHADKPWKAVGLCMLTSLFCDWTMCDQYLAIIIPGQMFQDTYDKLGLGRNMLSRTLEDLGTLWSPMCPWNSCGAYQAGVLGMSPFTYIPYAFMNIINPILAFVTCFLGRNIKYADGSYTGLFTTALKQAKQAPKAPEEGKAVALAALKQMRGE